MWLFTQDGFVSIVAYDATKDSNKQSKFREIAPEPGTHLLLRARVKEDLNTFTTADPDLVIETDPVADYAFRAVIERGVFKQWMDGQVDRLDYDSHFKEVTRDRAPKATGRYSAMMSVWSAMIRLQPYFRGAWATPTWIDGKYTSVSTFLDAEGAEIAEKNRAVKYTQPPLPFTPAPTAAVTQRDRVVPSFRYGYGAHRPLVTPATVDQPSDPVDLDRLVELLKEQSMPSLDAQNLLLTDEAFELWSTLEDDVDRGILDGTMPLSAKDVDEYAEFIREWMKDDWNDDDGVDTGHAVE